MAVEASHLNLFSPQLLATRETMNPTGASGNMFETQMGFGVPLSTTVATQGFLPLNNSLVTGSLIHQKIAAPAIKSESTLTYHNLPLKRSRESFQRQPRSINEPCFGNDISFRMEQQQFDIDRLISQHMQKMSMEIEEKRKRQAWNIMEAIEERVTKKLRGKEQEIEKIVKLNWALEDRVKSLCLENQIWKDLAQTNEATATALRSNLEQVLAEAAQIKVGERNPAVGLKTTAAVDEVDDAQSCCDSSWNVERRTFLEAEGSGGKNGDDDDRRLCRSCGEEESCALLLPCRHLCLCTVCGSGLHICPICKTPKNAILHVKMP